MAQGLSTSLRLSLLADLTEQSIRDNKMSPQEHLSAADRNTVDEKRVGSPRSKQIRPCLYRLSRGHHSLTVASSDIQLEVKIKLRVEAK